MLATGLLVMALNSDGLNTLDQALDRYANVSSYTVDIRSMQAGTEQVLHYTYRKPGFVRMDFVRPHHGALLVYDPYADRVRLWPLGLHHFPTLTLRPDNPLIRGASGQRVDHSDVGTLLTSVRALAQAGSVAVSEPVDGQGRRLWYLEVTAAPGRSLNGIHRYELWLEPDRLLPLQVVSHDASDQTLESVFMDGWEVNATLPDTVFNPE